MIGLLSASALLLVGLQAGIDRPRNAFNSCLSQTATKAAAEKVAGDAYQAYLETACSAQIGAFKTATINFDVKNGVGRKQATSDAEAMIGDWMQSNVNSYKAKRARENTERAQSTPPAARASDRGQAAPAG